MLLSQWFPPEHAPVGHVVLELAGELQAQGWEVTVITAVPNHPAGVVFPGYRKRWFQEDRVDGVRVWRVWLYASSRRSRAGRILTFLTFTLTSSWALLRRARPQVIFAVFQPLSVGLVLSLVARLKRARLVLNVQDLHPDAPIEMGLVRNRALIRLLYWLERFGYRHADGLAVLSEGFRRHCVARGAQLGRVAVVPNGLDLDEIRPQERLCPLRRELGLEENDIVVLHAGTAGYASGARVILDAAARLRDRPRLKFVFVGDGPLLPALKQQAATEQLANVLFAPFQPRERLNEVQSMADISLVTMAPGRGRTSVPSKLLGYLAAARPVAASVDADSETADLVRRSGCGEVVPPGDVEALAAAVLRLTADGERRALLGRKGRQYAEQHFARPVVNGAYADFLTRVLEGSMRSELDR